MAAQSSIIIFGASRSKPVVPGLWLQYTAVMLIVLAFLVSVFARARLQVAEVPKQKLQQPYFLELRDLFAPETGELNLAQAEALRSVAAQHDVRVSVSLFAQASQGDIEAGLQRAAELRRYLRQSAIPLEAIRVQFIEEERAVQAEVRISTEVDHE